MEQQNTRADLLTLIGILIFAAAGLTVFLLSPSLDYRVGSALVACIMSLSGSFYALVLLAQRQHRRWKIDALRTFVEASGTHSLLDGNGRIISADNGLRTVLDANFADPANFVRRLQSQANANGTTHETDRLRFDITPAGFDLFIWQVTELAPKSAPVELVAEPESKWSSIEDLPVPLLRIAKSGHVTNGNREARQLLGQTFAKPVKLSDLLEGLGRPVTDWIEDIASGRSGSSREFLRGTGDRQDFFVQVALHRMGTGADTHLVAVLHDMTEFKALEAQFVQSQKMQAIGQLAGGVAHDFNNLLTAIKGHCELLRLAERPEGQEDLSQIEQNVDRAAALVRQLLAFSRKQNLELEVIDANAAMADLTQLLNRLVGEKVQVHCRSVESPFAFRADKRQLEQVIVNLVVNARDAMPNGGRIGIETANVTLNRTQVRDRATLQAGDYLQIKVFDQGTGISPEKLRKIFEPFYTTKKVGEGTGLGLSTAYGIVKQSGGFIFVDSELGRGSTFSLYFPRYDNGTPKVVAEQAAPQIASAAKVLLVDDEAPVRAFATRALRLKGFEVIEADSGTMALEQLGRHGDIDLIVTDVMMPGLDGPSWVREARKTHPATHVIFMSGYAEETFAEHRAELDNTAFLPKPFSLAELTEAVQSALSVMGCVAEAQRCAAQPVNAA
ncbi:response regulator [Marivivens donghaensis]|uniref:histidine kinase n=1 Tax=Marivivens donghaensis TaxID=1699413 RepID=A0ABX0W034_9RHOB|nr:ATP-binding protein [Marivivens donghaensis]NIY72871.1 response regulator [Marivivens donghaensis]